MAEMYHKVAATYAEARPSYPTEWFSQFASLTPRQSVAWDVGTGNGQAAIKLAEFFEKVYATDISDEQLKNASLHPRIQYIHTPPSLSEDELVNLVGGENSVDLVTAATAVHWFDLEKFYSIVKRVLRKPKGIISVWTYNMIQVNPEVDSVMQKFLNAAQRFIDPRARYAFDNYENLPFPFESVGVGQEGKAEIREMRKEMSFEGVIGWLRTWAATVAAKEQGEDLLQDEMVKEIERAWGGKRVVRTVVYKAYIIAGKVRTTVHTE